MDIKSEFRSYGKGTKWLIIAWSLVRFQPGPPKLGDKPLRRSLYGGLKLNIEAIQ
jgi:hypothetical protein